ncbi:MAG: hypothetical protein V7727_13355 [Sneathiella sp.]
MGKPILDQTKEAIRDALKNTFLNHDDIAKQTGAGVSTVKRIKKDEGIKRPAGYAVHLAQLRAKPEGAIIRKPKKRKKLKESEIHRMFKGFSFANNAVNAPAMQAAAQ